MEVIKLLTIFILISSLSWASSPLPKFITKQSLTSIRFISNDGKLSLNQKRNGVLALSFNYRNYDVLSLGGQTEFLVRSSPSRKILLIEAQENPHQQFYINKTNKLYTLRWGDTKPRLIGEGINGKLHLNDQWLSSYQPELKKIIFTPVEGEEKPWSLKLSQKHNKYFRPNVVMLSSSTVLYTDINEKGESAFIKYDAKTAQTQLLYKSSLVGTKMELCDHLDYVALGEFPYEGVEGAGSSIYLVNKSSSNYSLEKTLYRTSDRDIGGIICGKDKIYFIKTLSENAKLNIKNTEVAEIDNKSGLVLIKSDLKKVSQVISIDDRILVPFRDDYFVVAGESNLSQDHYQKGSKVKTKRDER